MKHLITIFTIFFLTSNMMNIYCQDVACDTIIEYGENVIWGQNGEGQFDGGLNDWTIECEADTCWAWKEDTIVIGNFFTTTMISPTACNGFMSFNSDVLDTPKDMIDGLGICPAICSGSLISPVIDLSENTPEGLFLQFTQNLKQFGSKYSVLFSYDGGLSYPDTLLLNEDVILNSEEIKETVRFPIAAYDGQPSLRFKFHYSGNYYHWEIDDVLLIEDLNADMQVNEDWFAGAPQYKTPISQASEIPFMINLFNNGNLDAEDVQVEVDIERDGESVFTTVNEYGIVDGYTLNENIVFPNYYTPDAIGAYQGTYSVSSTTGNEDTSNDQLSFNFNVTENTFASIPNEEEGLPFQRVLEGLTLSGGYLRNYAMARLFYVPNGDGFTIKDVTFALDERDALASGFVQVLLLQVPANEDPTTNNFLGEETTIVGVISENVLIQKGEVERMNTIQLVATDENGTPMTNDNNEFLPVELEDQSTYAIVISTLAANEDEQIGILGAPYYDKTAENGQYSSGASGFAFQEAGFNEFRTGTYSAALYNGDIQGVQQARFGPWYSVNELFVEWTIEEMTVSSSHENKFSGISIFPNPTSNKVWINFDLDNNMEHTSIEISNLSEEIIRTWKYENLKDSHIEIDLKNIPTGLYHLCIINKDGITAKKLMVE